MRVIAGTFRGRTLKSPTWEGLRPTSDRLRETLFNILAPRIEGARVLDGYAGTGAVGIEAISRGASHVTFVESDRRAQMLIAENLAKCGISGGYAIIRDRADRAFTELKAASATFDLVVLDPPYADAVAEVLPTAGAVLATDGLLVLEHARKRRPPEAAGRLVRTREVTAGDSGLAFYRWQL